MSRIRIRRGLILSLVVAMILALLAACGGTSATPASGNASQPTIAPQSNPTQLSDTPSAQSSNQAPAPKACALLSVADLNRISGYSGGAATPTDLGEGSSSCHITTGKGEISVDVDAGAGVLPPSPDQKVVDLEGGAKGIVSSQSILDQDWMIKVNLPNATVTFLLGGNAASLDADKKIAQVTKADRSTETFAQVYEAIARAVAHNAASGGQLPSGVVQQGDPCAALTLDDVKQVVVGFNFDPPDYQDSTFGGKQCIYRFQSDNPRAGGFATLLYITQPKFEGDKSSFQQISGVGDEAYMLPDGSMLDFRKGDKYVYMTFTVAGLDESALQKFAPLMKDGLQQLAQKAAARIK